jgi:hypothetical protein
MNLLEVEATVMTALLEADDFASAALFESPADLTISARAGMAHLDQLIGKDPGEDAEVLLKLYDMLNRVQANHCEGAILGDVVRAANVIHVLTPYGEFIHSHGIPAAFP